MGNIAKTAAIIIFATALVVPSAALAETKTSQKISGDALTVTTTYTSADKAPAAEEYIELDGSTWDLANASTEPDPNYAKGKKSYEYTTAEVVLTPEQNAALYAQFPTTHEISDGEYIGEIPLVDATSTVSYRSVSGQVDRSYTVAGGLSSNDVDTLYALGYRTMDFETRSDASYGATTTQSLDLAYPHFFVVARDSYGIPSEYGVTLNYRGSESWLEIDHYTADATYRGDIETNVQGMVSTATYSRQEDPIVEEPDVRTDYTPFVVAGGLVAAVGVGLVGFWVTRRVRLCEAVDGGVEVVEKMKPVGDGKRYIVEVKAPIDLRKTYFLDVPGKWARKDGQLEMRANGKTVYIGKWAKRIDIRPQDEGTVM